jgi:hypothetical protein
MPAARFPAGLLLAVLNTSSLGQICTDVAVQAQLPAGEDWVSLRTSPPSPLRTTVRATGRFHETFCLPPGTYTLRFARLGKRKKAAPRPRAIAGRFGLRSQGVDLAASVPIAVAAETPFEVQCKACGAGRYALNPCSVVGGTEATCAPCSPQCAASTFQLDACSGTRDRMCQTCMSCPVDAYEVRQCSSVADAVCVQCPPCPPGMHTYMPCTGQSDRKICIEDSEEQFVLAFFHISGVFFMTCVVLWIILLLLRCVIVCLFGFDTLVAMGGDWTPPGGRRGATEREINELQIKTFNAATMGGGGSDGGGGGAEGEEGGHFGQMLCSICLDEFEDGDQVRELRCHHIFHVQCVDTWLLTKNQCPLCNRVITGGEHGAGGATEGGGVAGGEAGGGSGGTAAAATAGGEGSVGGDGAAEGRPPGELELLPLVAHRAQPAPTIVALPPTTGTGGQYGTA